MGRINQSQEHQFRPEKAIPKDTPRSPRFSLRLAGSEDFPALILEKRTLFFQGSLNSLSIRLSKAILELKMAANSTYWKAKPDFLQPVVWGGFNQNQDHRFCPKKAIQKDTPRISPIQPPICLSRRLFGTDSRKTCTNVLGISQFSVRFAVWGHIGA